MCAKPIATAALLLIVTGCAAESKKNGERTMLENMYSKVSKSTGKEYAIAREELLKQNGIKEFLDRAVTKAPTGSEEHWLARIVLARSKQPQAFARLEQTFVEKAGLCYPIRRRGDTDYTCTTPFLATEPLPSLESLQKQWSSNIGVADNLRLYYERQQLPNSSLWPDFLGEIVMKGWMLPPVEQVSLSSVQSEKRTPVRGRRSYPTFSEDETLCQVVGLLGNLKEMRCRVAVERIVKDEERSERLRKLAAVCLGKLGDERSVDVLLGVVEDTKAPDPVRNWAVGPIGEIGGDKAIAALERLINTPSIKTSNGRNFESDASNVLQNLRERKQQPATP